MPYAEKSGKGWRARWHLLEVSPDGRPKMDGKSGFPTKSAARKYAEDQEAAIRAGTYIDPKAGQIPLRDWWAEWFPVQEYKPNTRETYAQQWRRHIEPRWGGMPMRSIRGIDMEKWIKQLREEMSASTVTVITSALAGAFEDAVFNEIIPKSPMPPKGKRRSRKTAAAKPKRKGVVITPPEAVAILARMPTAADRLMVLTSLFTGMRWSEFAAMRRQYLTLEPGGGGPSGTYYIHPTEGAVHEDASANRFLGASKSGPGRIMDLPPFLVLMLAAYLETLPAGQDILFPNTKGEFHRYDTWNNFRWHPACDGRPASVSPSGRSVREAIPPVHQGLVIHDMKHTHAAMMDDLGTHPAMRNYRLGHIAPGAPGVYQHPTEQMRRELLAGLEKVWSGWAVLTPTPIPLQSAPDALF
jgi:integrase